MVLRALVASPGRLDMFAALPVAVSDIGIVRAEQALLHVRQRLVLEGDVQRLTPSLTRVLHQRPQEVAEGEENPDHRLPASQADQAD